MDQQSTTALCQKLTHAPQQKVGEKLHGDRHREAECVWRWMGRIGCIEPGRLSLNGFGMLAGNDRGRRAGDLLINNEIEAEARKRLVEAAS